AAAAGGREAPDAPADHRAADGAAHAPDPAVPLRRHDAAAHDWEQRRAEAPLEGLWPGAEVEERGPGVRRVREQLEEEQEPRRVLGELGVVAGDPPVPGRVAAEAEGRGYEPLARADGRERRVEARARLLDQRGEEGADPRRGEGVGRALACGAGPLPGEQGLEDGERADVGLEAHRAELSCELAEAAPLVRARAQAGELDRGRGAQRLDEGLEGLLVGRHAAEVELAEAARAHDLVGAHAGAPRRRGAGAGAGGGPRRRAPRP